MKHAFKNLGLALLSLIFIPVQLIGQLYEVSLDEKIEKSALIVEGKVVESQCYRADDGNIYTANKVQLVSVLKGDYRENYLTVTTWGGEIDDELQTWTHLLTLDRGDYGIFFLQPTRVPIIKSADFPTPFDVYSGVQGFVAFTRNETKALVGYEPFHTYTDIPNDLYSHIERKTGQKRTVASAESNEIRNGVRYHFTNIGFDGTSVTFDVYVNSLLGTKKLHTSGIQFNYNPAFFGSNIATNGNLLLQDAGISQSSTYDLTQSNVTSSKVKIELVPVGSLAGLTEIGTTEQLLAKGKITIQNILADPGIVYDISEMQSMSKFYEEGLSQVFDTVIVEGSWRPGEADPEIESIDPKIVPGGTDSIITITGTNFGTFVEGQSKVWFYDASQGPSPFRIVEPLYGDYEYWDNNKIIVQVPSYTKRMDSTQFKRSYYAGNGLIQVCNAMGGCSFPTSLDLVTVKYSVFNDRTGATDIPKNAGLPSILRNSNGENAISIKFSSAFEADPDAKASVIRAINTWKCTTKVNWDTDSDAPNNDNSNMGLVYYDDLPIGTTGTTWAVTPNTINKCKDNASGAYVQAYQVYFKVAFNQNITFWHKEESLAGLDNTKIDMQSVALHEFGHAHNLNHVNASSDVMYFGISKGDAKRTLQPFDIEGGKWVIAKSFAIILDSNCPAPMYPADISGLDCSSVGTYYLTGEERIISYPNPVAEFLFIKIPENKLTACAIEVYNITGQKAANRLASGHEVQEGIKLDTSNLTAGIYIVRIQVTEDSFSIVKIVKQ